MLANQNAILPKGKTLWPLQSQCNEFYGNPEHNPVVWEALHLSTVLVPFDIYYPGKFGPILVKHITIHRLCNKSLANVLNEIWKSARHDQKIIHAWGMDIYNGSYARRDIRQNPGHISMHEYACAVDFDAKDKPMGQTQKRFPWQVTNAFKNEGWINLLHDPMHFQAARIG